MDNEIIPIEPEEIEPKKNKGRWPKGVSGNPKGRPKKGIALTDKIEAALLERQEGNGTRAIDELVKLLIKRSLEGDMKALEILLDRGFGKSKAFLEISQKEEFEIDWGDDVVEADTDEESTDSDS